MKIGGTIKDERGEFPPQRTKIEFRGKGKIQMAFARFGNHHTSQSTREWEGRYTFYPNCGAEPIFATGVNDFLGLSFMRRGN